ncbi:unnamed protein product [Mytilus edulis]|uniref:Uncharacterized protein n=1 Tax=Mytilus edulis TaxID=6550 RepID=A0A8S3PYX6_MYTED|nr:unnamed protein product [Mytilus edulis]
MKPGKNFVIEFSTAAFEATKNFLLSHFTSENFNNNLAVKEQKNLDSTHITVDHSYRIYNRKNNGQIGSQLKYVVNVYNTTSLINVNGSRVELFVNGIFKDLCAYLSKHFDSFDILNNEIANYLEDISANYKDKDRNLGNSASSILKGKSRQINNRNTNETLCQVTQDNEDIHSDSILSNLSIIDPSSNTHKQLISNSPAINSSNDAKGELGHPTVGLSTTRCPDFPLATASTLVVHRMKTSSNNTACNANKISLPHVSTSSKYACGAPPFNHFQHPVSTSSHIPLHPIPSFQAYNHHQFIHQFQPPAYNTPNAPHLNNIHMAYPSTNHMDTRGYMIVMQQSQQCSYHNRANLLVNFRFHMLETQSRQSSAHEKNSQQQSHSQSSQRMPSHLQTILSIPLLVRNTNQKKTIKTKVLWEQRDEEKYRETILNELLQKDLPTLDIDKQIDIISNSLLNAQQQSIPSKITQLKGPKWKATPEVTVLLRMCKVIYNKWADLGKPIGHPLSLELKIHKKKLRQRQRMEQAIDRNTIHNKIMNTSSSQMFHRLIRRNLGDNSQSAINCIKTDENEYLFLAKDQRKAFANYYEDLSALNRTI